MLGPEHITTDVYFPVAELGEYGDKYKKVVTSIVQLFAQGIAIPHLHHYVQRCAVTGSTLLRERTLPPIRIESIAHPELIPPPIARGVSHFRISGRESGTLKPFLRAIETAQQRQESYINLDIAHTVTLSQTSTTIENTDTVRMIPAPHIPPHVPGIRTVTLPAIEASLSVTPPDPDISQRHIRIAASTRAILEGWFRLIFNLVRWNRSQLIKMEVFSATNLEVDTGCFNRDLLLFTQHTDRFGNRRLIRPTVILSIGPYTDKALEKHNVVDVLIPHLCEMVRTTRREKWVEALEKGDWGFSPEAREDISNALFADLNVPGKLVRYFISNKLYALTSYLCSSEVARFLLVYFLPISHPASPCSISR